MITRKIRETIPELLWQNIITVFCVLWFGGGGRAFPVTENEYNYGPTT